MGKGGMKHRENNNKKIVGRFVDVNCEGQCEFEMDGIYLA